MRYNIGDHRNVASIDDSYDFVSIDYEVESIKESLGIVSDHACLFVKIGNAEYVEVWGLFGIVPYLDKTLTCLYSLEVDAIRNEISHTYHSIGELAKTRRFPTHKTFMERVESWIATNHRSNLSAEDVSRYALYVAVNRHWITIDSAINWNGLSRDSAYWERAL